MRNRTTILCLLACIFAGMYALAANRQAAACLDRNRADSDELISFSFGNDGSCAVEPPSTPLEQLLLLLTLGCVGATLVSAGKVWIDRQQDRALLQSATFAWERRRHHYQ